MANTALLIIDIQKFYFKGASPLPYAEQALVKAKEVLRIFRQQGKTIIHVKHHAHLGDLDELHEDMQPLPGEILVEKDCPSAFLQTNLQSILESQDIDHLVIMGMMSNMCVDTTVRACQDYGIGVTLVQDACAASEITFGGETIPADVVHKVFMGAVSGAFAKVIDASELEHM